MSNFENPFYYLTRRVGEWHVKEFGECSNKRICRKLLEESAEFMVDKTEEEAADVLIMLMAWAHRNNVDLLQAARKKFEVVRHRDQAARDIGTDEI